MADDLQVTTGLAAKPWYQSQTVLAITAGIILTLAPKAALLVGINLPITQDQANYIASLVLPQVVALFGRLKSTTVVTTTAAKAADINLTQAKIMANIEALRK